jgi:hypothetical protein
MLAIGVCWYWRERSRSVINPFGARVDTSPNAFGVEEGAPPSATVWRRQRWLTPPVRAVMAQATT